MIELSYPGDLADANDLAPQLSTTGLNLNACESKAQLFAKAAAALAVIGEAGHARTPLAFFVPGRIEVLGKHTDYAGGRTMVAAVERGFCLVGLPRDDRQMIVIDAESGETVRFHVDPELQPPTGAWSNYPMTVARRVARNFPGANRGVDLALASDLPPAAGMSSSSALMVGVFLILSEVNRLSARNEYWHNIGNSTDLAGYLGTVENGQTFGTLAGDRGVGTFGGSEDHTAILCAEPNRISQYAYCPVEFEKMLPVPPGHVFAVAASGVVAEKTGAALEKYNRASRLTSALVELWRRETGRSDPHLAAALGSSPDAAERFTALVETVALPVREKGDSPRPTFGRCPPERPEGCCAQMGTVPFFTSGDFDRPALAARLEHFMIESGKIIPAAGDALAGGDLRAFGRLVDRSQQAAEKLLGNQVPETVFLAAAARRLGAAAASAFGAGFGGSVWALVETAKADQFLAAWSEQYCAEFPQHAALARFFITGAGPAAFRVC